MRLWTKMLLLVAGMGAITSIAVAINKLYIEIHRFHTLPIVLKTGKPSPTRAQLRKAMKYHGIIYTWEENGTWWFKRDGEVCKLF